MSATTGFATRFQATIASTGLGSPVVSAQITTLANTEYSYIFPVGTRAYSLQHRSGSMVKWSHSLGTTSTPDYVSLYPGSFIEQDGLSGSGLELYFQSPGAGTIFEVLSWS